MTGRGGEEGRVSGLTAQQRFTRCMPTEWSNADAGNCSILYLQMRVSHNAGRMTRKMFFVQTLMVMHRWL